MTPFSAAPVFRRKTIGGGLDGGKQDFGARGQADEAQ